MTIEQTLSILGQTPDRVTELTAGVGGPQFAVAPTPGEWPIVEVLAHLRSCADVWGG